MFGSEASQHRTGVDMGKIRFALMGFCVTLLLGAGLAFADSAAIRTMAKITMSLNHYPSDDDKATLNAIIDGDESSDDEAAIAMALTNMQHKVTEDDAERLVEIVNDEQSSASARKLAGILLSINHMPSTEDKAVLATLASM